ncbi:MAG: phosphotransferase family protein [Acidimicrobiales bacterium]
MPETPTEITTITDALTLVFGRDDADVEVGDLERLTGGASRETYRFRVTVDGNDEWFILQRERSVELRHERGMAAEASVVRVAAEAQMPVPEIVATNESHPDCGIGPSWFIGRAVDGESIARRIQRDDEYAEARARFAADTGAALGRLHSIPTDQLARPDLAHLEHIDELAKWREAVDELSLVSPTFELAFRWLEQHRPAPTGVVLVHGDFRLGNLMVGPDGLAAVLDWELAHLGDPLEDLGWLCTRAWRFGGAGPVGGIGDYEDLFAAHEAATGTPVDRDAFAWWQLLGTLKWGIMCSLQANAHRTGVVESLELLAIGNRIAEQEYDVAWAMVERLGQSVDQTQIDDLGLGATRAPGTGQPQPDELAGALATFLTNNVQPALSGGLAFHVRVAANVASMLEREAIAGDAQRRRHRDRLAALGAADDAELADGIRRGAFDDRLGEVAGQLALSTAERLAVVNPRWLAT